jgi:hypothetical protein
MSQGIGHAKAPPPDRATARITCRLLPLDLESSRRFVNTAQQSVVMCFTQAVQTNCGTVHEAMMANQHIVSPLGICTITPHTILRPKRCELNLQIWHAATQALSR